MLKSRTYRIFAAVPNLEAAMGKGLPVLRHKQSLCNCGALFFTTNYLI